MKVITYRLCNLTLGDAKSSLIMDLSYLNTLEIIAMCLHVCTSTDFEHIIFFLPYCT